MPIPHAPTRRSASDRARRLAARAVLPALLPLAPLVTAGAQERGQERPVPPWERRSAPTIGIGGGALYSGARGSGARVGDGVGFDVQGTLGISALALGVGYQRTSHGLPNTTTSATYQGVFVEPRLAIAPYGNFTPYVAGRVGFLRQDVPASTTWQASRRNMTQLGGGVGTLVSVAPSVQLDLGALWTDVRGRGDVATQPVPGPFVGGTGSGVVLRAGIVLGLDRWGR